MAFAVSVATGGAVGVSVAAKGVELGEGERVAVSRTG
jgi:hypothetical protein